MSDQVVREEHVARWEWDNLAGLYRCMVLWSTGDTCGYVDSGFCGLPWQAEHVRVFVFKDDGDG